MLNQLFPNPDVLKRLTASSLGSLIQSYAMSHAGKLSPSTMQHRIRAAAHFGYWLDTQHIGINNVDACVLERFINHFSTCCCPQSRAGEHLHTAIGAREFLMYLGKTGVISPFLPMHEESSARKSLLDKFFQWTVDLLVRGKGRKQRELRLWKSVAQSIRAWLSVRGHATVPELFLNAQGKQMTRAGFEYVLERCRVKAVKQCSSLVEKKLSPHVLRHTCALTVLKATGDLRQVALWLGHESTATTECYLQLDPLEKLQSIAGFVPTSLKPGKFRPSDRLIAMLRGDNIM